MSIFLLRYEISCKPLNDKFADYIEVINEILYLMAITLSFCLTQFVGDPYIRFNLGKALIAFTLISFFLNLAAFFYEIFSRNMQSIQV